MSTKKKILLFADWYEPGYRAGGPIRSCVNFVQNMKDDYAIYVFTSDRDLDASSPYENIPTDQWIISESDSRYYCSPANLNWKNIRQQMDTVRPDFIYLNSMFSTYFTIYPLLISSRNRFQGKIVLTPRGMLRESAINFKPLKKRFFLSLFNLLGFPRRIFFQATDDTEAKDIRQYFGVSVKMMQVSNFPALMTTPPEAIEKNPGSLSMVYVGRIHPIKNLYFLLEAMQKLSALIHLSIVGTLEDEQYWQNCRSLILRLPSNITVNYMGEIPNQQLQPIIAQQHIFALPTMGENFGHAIYEALSQGKPVLISDQTPWRGLSGHKAGWDLPLTNPALFSQAMESAACFDQQQYNEWSHHAWSFAHDFNKGSNLREEYVKLFN